MAGRKRVQPETASASKAPDDNVKKRRVSTRVANSTSKKRKRVSDADEAQDTQDGTAVEQAKPKRPRWGPVAGRLAGLMEMPMDILFEIFGHLMPLDVLRLARTTKQFRRVLMHRSAISVWIAARRNVPDLPDCPPYMSEPKFANLAFDTHCHECLSPHIRSVDWRIGRRICSKCAKECMVEDYSAFSGESVYKAVPSKYGKRGRPSYYSKDLNEFQQKRASFTDPEARDKFVKERQGLVFEMEMHGALLEAWAANQAKGRSEQLDDLRRERKEAIVEKLTELGWGPEIEQIPYRDDLSHHKLVKQPTRLTPRIWANIQSEMINYMQQMKAQRLERERKALVISRKRIAVSILRAYKIAHLPLEQVMPEPMDFCAFPQVLEILELPTETAVTEDTFTGVVEQMDDLVAQWRGRILGQLVQRVKDCQSHKSKVNCLDENGDTVPMEPIASTSSSDPKGKGKAKAVEPHIPDDPEIIEKLTIATTVFNCKSCNPRFSLFFDMYDSSSEDDFMDPWGLDIPSRRHRGRSNPLFYPKVMGHRCLTKQRGFNWDHPGSDPTRQLDYPMGTRTKWMPQPLQLDEKAGKVVANIVTTCGLDPATTTTAQMDELDPQLACLDCLQWSDEELDEADASVFSWRAAVNHSNQKHASRTNVKWKVLDDELKDEVVNVDEEFRDNQTLISALMLSGLVPPGGLNTEPPEDVSWLCAHCLDLPQEKDCMELSKIKTHCTMMHNIEEPQANVDYYQDYEAPQGRKPQYAPQLKITLAMERPDDVPGPGEGHAHDPWGFGISDDEYDDEVYDDYYNDYFF
ncbi:hypothetical protein HYDPIDRAFT_129407 [Hydnomerulius pinastri MD-312]|nr:hypothetical protein HYDPIDRAFT_129407 [Hydnomerulius pinastri MD-312]